MKIKSCSLILVDSYAYVLDKRVHLKMSLEHFKWAQFLETKDFSSHWLPMFHQTLQPKWELHNRIAQSYFTLREVIICSVWHFALANSGRDVDMLHNPQTLRHLTCQLSWFVHVIRYFKNETKTLLSIQLVKGHLVTICIYSVFW